MQREPFPRVPPLESREEHLGQEWAQFRCFTSVAVAPSQVGTSYSNSAGSMRVSWIANRGFMRVQLVMNIRGAGPL